MAIVIIDHENIGADTISYVASRSVIANIDGNRFFGNGVTLY